VRIRGRPFPLVLAAPSGAGKTSLAHGLVDRNDDIGFSVSATTRPARSFERPGVDYHFVDDAEFSRMIDAGELVEWADVHGRRYGTPRASIERVLATEQVVVLDIDIQGARQIRSAFGGEAVLVFILPPSARELNRRLAGRGSEAESERLRRLENARRELTAAAEFDYVVVNDSYETALALLEEIVRCERRRTRRIAHLQEDLGRLDRELQEILERSE
jgi:guanylate kinase